MKSKPRNLINKCWQPLQLAIILPLIMFAAMSGCGKEEEQTVPRPKGFPRIDLPEKAWQSFQNSTCPFTFEYPQYGTVEKARQDSCIMDLYFPQFQARWHITYRNIPQSGKTVGQHSEEYRKLVFKHIQKAAQIQTKRFQAPEGNGILYELYGTIGVPAQLFFTDSTNIFMASFYFDTAVRNDSLKPVINRMKEELLHLAQTLNWQTPEEG